MQSNRFLNRRIWLVAVIAAAPLLAGAECSRNTVAQSAATTAANVFVTQLVNAIFAQLTPG